MIHKGHGNLRGWGGLVYKPKQCRLLGWFDLFYDRKITETFIFRGRRDLFYDTKVHHDIYDRFYLVYDPKKDLIGCRDLL